MEGEMCAPGFVDNNGYSVRMTHGRECLHVGAYAVVGRARDKHGVSIRVGSKRAVQRFRLDAVRQFKLLVQCWCQIDRVHPTQNQSSDNALVHVPHDEHLFAWM